MIEDLHIASDPADVTYYAGIIESLFAFTTFMTVLLWGRLSDRIGKLSNCFQYPPVYERLNYPCRRSKACTIDGVNRCR